MSIKLYDNDYLHKLQILFSKTKDESCELLDPHTNETIADIGCGIGQDAINLAKSGARIYGIDNDPNFIAIANKQSTDNLNVNFICCNADNIPLESGTIDKIRFDRVLQHITDQDKVLKESSRLLKPRGLLQIIDTDYLSISLFIEDEKIERKIIDAIAYKRIANGHKVRRLPNKIIENNFTLLSTKIHNYIINDYSLAKSLLRFDIVFDEELEKGNISNEDYEVWQKHSKEHFNLSVNLMLLTAEKN